MRLSHIPLFAEKPSHSFVPLGRRAAGARSEGQGRPKAGAPRASLTAASTLAGWRRSGVGSVAALALSLLVAGALPGVAMAQIATVERPVAHHPYAAYVADAARRFSIPEAWIWAVMRVESNGDPRAVSTAGAIGLMQIMPATWAALRARYGLGADPFDARDNIMAGAAYLRELHDRYGDVAAMLAAYNAGAGRYDDFVSRGRPLPGETRAYLARLASITGGAGDGQGTVAALPNPFAWRRSALFVRVASSAEPLVEQPTRSTIAVSEPSDGARSQSTASAASSAPTDTLFVSRASAGRPQ